MASVCDACKRDKCRVRMDGLKTCDMRVAESNYEKLFGTPERAARTLVERLDVGVLEWCNNECESCPYEYDGYGCEQVLTLLEWLESEACDG